MRMSFQNSAFRSQMYGVYITRSSGYLGSLDGGLVCGTGKPPKYTAEQYADLKKKANSTSEVKTLQDKEEIQRKLSNLNKRFCKSGKCELDETVGQALCTGNKNILFENGKGCNQGELAKTLAIGQKPDPIPAGGKQGIQDSLGKNCKSGKCYWNEKIGQAICGDGDDGGKPISTTKANSGSLITGTHVLVIVATAICL